MIDEMRRLLAAVPRWLRARPLTVAVVILLIAANVLVRVLDQVLGTSLRTDLSSVSVMQTVAGRALFVPVSMLISERWMLVAVHVLLTLVLLDVAERRLGWLRALVGLVVAGLGGTVIGMLLLLAGLRINELWSLSLVAQSSSTVWAPLTGVLMAATGVMNVFWRRRVRMVGYSLLIALLLFGATPGHLYALLAAVIGQLLGMWWGRDRHVHVVGRSSHHEARVLLATMVAVLGVGPVLTVFSAMPIGPLAPLGLLLSEGDIDISGSGPNSDHLARCLASDQLTGCLHEFSVARVSTISGIVVTILPTLLLLVSAYGILRGRRVAAWMAIGINLAYSLLSLWYFLIGPFLIGGLSLNHHHGVGEITFVLLASALAPLVVSAMLVGGLRHLQLRPSRRRLIGAITASLGTFVLLSALYLIVGVARPGDFTPQVSFGGLLADLPERFLPAGFLGLTKPGFLPVEALASTIYHWMGPVTWLVVVISSISLLQVVPPRSERAARAKVDDLLLKGGHSLSFMATWPHNTYWFSSTGRVGIAYRASHGVALTVGEPFGAENEIDAATLEFVRFCDDHALVPVFYSVHDHCRDLLAAHGWSSQPVGLESVIDPVHWQTKGKRWQDVRTAINRAKREGVTDRLSVFADLSLATQLQIKAISEEWVSEKALPEMGFTLGGVEQLRDRRVRLLLAENEDGQVLAVTSWLPFWRDGRVVGWTLDFMRRHPDSSNGVMEFLIARMAERLQEEGEAESMSLSAAPLAGLDEDDGSALSRLLAAISGALEPVYGFRSLFFFKRKFQPEEQQISVVYPDASALSSIALAVTEAYVPGMRLDQLVTSLLRSEATSDVSPS